MVGGPLGHKVRINVTVGHGREIRARIEDLVLLHSNDLAHYSDVGQGVAIPLRNVSENMIYIPGGLFGEMDKCLVSSTFIICFRCLRGQRLGAGARAHIQG